MQKNLGITLFIAALMFASLSLVARLQAGSGAADTASVFTVNSNSDIPDFNPGDGVCSTDAINHICTLRAAIQEANHHPGADIINLQPNMTYTLTRAGADNNALNGDLDITDSVTINGAGPDSTIIDGNGSLTHDRVFEITGTVMIEGVTIEHGESGNEAGGIMNYGKLTLDHTDIISNTAIGINNWGGGIVNSGPITISNSLIRGNTTGNSNAYGGGMYNQGLMLLLNSTVSDNTTPGNGGGIFNIGYTSTLMNSTISGNTGLAGGGIYKGGYALYVINSTISGNFSTTAGGGMYVYSGSANLYNVTLADNIANSDNSGTSVGGGVTNDSGTLSFINTIIANNGYLIEMQPHAEYKPDDCSGTITSQGNNIIKDLVALHCTINGSYTLTDPTLGPLQNNGGPTLTEAPLAGSPAIDMGNSGGCNNNVGASITTDQRSYLRPADGDGNGSAICDIGALEYNALPPCSAKPVAPVLLTPTNNRTIKKTKVTLTWGISNCAITTYNLIVKKDSTGGTTIAKPKGITNLNYVLNGLTKGHSYYWKIKACSAGYGCRASHFSKFTVHP